MEENQKRIRLLSEEKVSRALLKLGLPTMAGMMVSALYNVVDAFFVGRLGTLQTAAISVVYPLTMIGMGVGLLFGSGASSSISRFLGKEEYEKVKAYSCTSLFSGLLTMIVVAAGMLACFDPLMNALGATPGTLSYAREYGILFIIGLVFNVFNMMMNNMIIAEGGSLFSMSAMLAGGMTNLVLDPVFIFGLHLGVRGSAIATLISRLVSTGLYLFYLWRKNTCLNMSPRYFRPTSTLYKGVLKIGLPVCFFQFLTGGAVSLTNIAAKPFGDTAIAAMGIVNRLMTLESNALFGFLKGYSPLVGYNYGAGSLERVRQSTRLALCWSTAANIIWGLLCIAFSGPLIYLFNQQSTEVLAIGKAALTVDAVAFMTLGVQIVIGNYFLSVGKARQGGILSVCRQGLFFIPMLLIFTHLWGLNGLIASQLAADLCAALLTVILWKKERASLAIPAPTTVQTMPQP